MASPAFTDDALLLAGTADGLIRSEDAGDSWSRLWSAAGSCRSPFRLFRPGPPGAGRHRTRRRAAVHRWRANLDQRQPGPAGPHGAGSAFSPSFDVDQTMFAGRTPASFARKTRVERGERSRACLADRGAIARPFAALFPEPVILAGTESSGLLRSTDGGARWPRGALAGAKRHGTGVVDDGGVIAGTDVGVMVSADCGRPGPRSVGESGPF